MVRVLKFLRSNDIMTNGKLQAEGVDVRVLKFREL